MKFQIDIKKTLLVLISLLIVSFAMQILLCDANYNKIFSGKESTNLDVTNYSGYDVVGDTYIVTNEDPQILSAANNFVSTILVNLSEPVKSSINFQIFYAADSQNFTEENSVSQTINAGEQNAYINIPYDNYEYLRMDIGSSIGQSFRLSNINYYDYNVTILDNIVSKINLDITIILFLAVAIVYYYIIRNKKILFASNAKKLETIFLFFSFSILTIWALVQPYDAAPDEYMRYDLIQYLYNNNRLPHGGDGSIRNSIWGISYAFMPYLSGMISVVFMKVVSIFTSNSQALILAARMAVVMFGIITIHFIMKISNKLFTGIGKWIFVILISCLPQFVFLGTYMGNDMISLMAIAMIINYWIDGAQTKWCLRSVVGLSVSLSICLLSYYNAYSFVLMSAVFFFWTSVKNRVDKKIIIKNCIIISTTVLILAGWFFIRNAILYDGDFLGLRTVNEYAEKYATEQYKPSNRLTPLNQGTSLKYMLFDMGWLKYTYSSFVGYFRYMSIAIYSWIYKYYLLLFGIGGAGLLLGFFFRKRKNDDIIKNNDSIAFKTCLIVASIITVTLSMYNSFTADFQPQGRYIMPILLPLMYFVTLGLSNILKLIKSDIIKRTVGIGICVFNIYILILCFKDFILGTYL